MLGLCVVVVLEFLEYGALQSYVKKGGIPEETKLLFAGDVAAGLEHVNSKGAKREYNGVAMADLVLHFAGFVHRDVAARNVLVSSLKRCKIAGMTMCFPSTFDEGDLTVWHCRLWNGPRH